jgi:hypothetical protein
MATLAVNHSDKKGQPACGLSFRQAMDVLSREERFMAMVQAMNTVLLQKGVYTKEELEGYYCQWAEAQVARPKKERMGRRAGFISRLLALFAF